MTTLSTPAEVAAWERAYDAAIAAGMQESAGTFADRKIVELRKRQGAPDLDPPVSLLSCGLCGDKHLDPRCPTANVLPCVLCKQPIEAGKAEVAMTHGGGIVHAGFCPPVPQPSPPVAREKLGEWDNEDEDVGVVSRQNESGDIKACARADGSWDIWDHSDVHLKCGTATIGTFPTLLAAAQHAVDSSAEARERYEWEGQEDDDSIACEECGQLSTSVHPVIQPEVGGPWVHLTCPPAAPTGACVSCGQGAEIHGDGWECKGFQSPTTPPSDHLADAGKKVAPTEASFDGAHWTDAEWTRLKDCARECGTWQADAVNELMSELITARTAPTRAEVEAERVKWDAASGPLDFWEWLGWTERESDDYEHRGIIPAKPLRIHAQAPTPRYYIATSGGGEDVLWWKPNRSGYTTNLDAAGLYSREEAAAIERLRDKSWTDIAIPEDQANLFADRRVSREKVNASKLPPVVEAPESPNGVEYDMEIVADGAPTREHVEVAVSLVGDPLHRLAPWDHLGWTEKEWWSYDREGTIPARPLKLHAEKPRQYSDSNSLQSDFAAAALERSRYALAENERERAAQLDAVPAPVTDTLSPANGTRAPDAVRAAVEALVKCEHPSANTMFVEDIGVCELCGSVAAGRHAWELPRLVAALIAAK